MPRKRTPRGWYASATALTRGFQATTYGQWLHITTTTVAGGTSSSGAAWVLPCVSGSSKAGIASPIACTRAKIGDSRLFASVPLERLRHQTGLLRPVLEEVNDANCGIGAFDASLDQREVPGIAEPELVEPLGLSQADIARGGAARRIGILMMSNECLPVCVSRPLHGFPDLCPGIGHVSFSGSARSVSQAVSRPHCLGPAASSARHISKNLYMLADNW